MPSFLVRSLLRKLVVLIDTCLGKNLATFAIDKSQEVNGTNRTHDTGLTPVVTQLQSSKNFQTSLKENQEEGVL